MNVGTEAATCSRDGTATNKKPGGRQAARGDARERIVNGMANEGTADKEVAKDSTGLTGIVSGIREGWIKHG